MIKKIVVDIDGKEVELTKKQALKLRDDLNDMFGSPIQAPVTIPYPVPVQPLNPWRPTIPQPGTPYYLGDVTC